MLADPTVKLYLDAVIFNCCWEDLPRGAVIGCCYFDEFLPTAEHRIFQSDDEVALGDWSDGRWAWHVSQNRMFYKSFSLRGFPAVFNWSPPDGLLKSYRVVLES